MRIVKIAAHILVIGAVMVCNGCSVILLEKNRKFGGKMDYRSYYEKYAFNMTPTPFCGEPECF